MKLTTIALICALVLLAIGVAVYLRMPNCHAVSGAIWIKVDVDDSSSSIYGNTVEQLPAERGTTTP